MPDTAAVLESKAAAELKNTAYTGPAATWISLHTGDPGASGTFAELTTGAGVNARQQATFTGAAGVENPNATLTYSGFAVNSVITHLGIWSAQTGGTFLGSFPLVTTYRLFTAVSGGPLIVCPAHALVATTKVRMIATPQQGVVLPVPLSPVTPGSFLDGTCNNSTAFTSATANFTQGDVGLAIVQPSNTNIPAGTTIASVTNATTIVLSQAATGGAVTTVNFTLLNRGLYYVIATGLTTDVFEVSLTSGGGAIANFTASGGGLVALDKSVTILNTTDQVQIPAANLTYTQS